MKRTLLLSLSLAAATVFAAQSALAADMVLSKRTASTLIEDNVGHPFWSLQAQCAGAFGATYKYHMTKNHPQQAEEDKGLGVAMLDDAIARLQVDRGVDRAAALEIAVPEVEYGRAVAQKMLDERGTAPDSRWNFYRSTCLDIEQAYRNQSDN